MIVATKKLEWTVFEDKRLPTNWRVEAFGEDGECYVTIFSGPDAEDRARNYHASLSG